MLSNVLTLAEFHQKLLVERPYHNCLNVIQLVRFQAQSLCFSFISGDTFSFVHSFLLTGVVNFSEEGFFGGVNLLVGRGKKEDL